MDCGETALEAVIATDAQQGGFDDPFAAGATIGEIERADPRVGVGGGT